MRTNKLDAFTGNDAMLRVFFLGAVGPARAKAYLEREAAVYDDLEQLLAATERGTDWSTSDFNRYGRLVIESGRRFAREQATWARWAAAQVDDLDELGDGR